MKTTRRNFIGAIAAIGALSLIGRSVEQDDWFEDIRVDRYYELQGGHYGDTGGCGCPGYQLGAELIENMKYWEQCRYFEHNIESVEERGFYLSPTQYFGAPYKKYDRIYLTKKWLVEFYNRHKNDDKKDWEFRYDKYLRDVKSGTYRLDNNY